MTSYFILFSLNQGVRGDPLSVHKERWLAEDERACIARDLAATFNIDRERAYDNDDASPARRTGDYYTNQFIIKEVQQ